MTTPLDTIDVHHSALLLMDLQERYLTNLPSTSTSFLGTVAETAGRAREAGMRVLYPCVSFRPGQPELSSRNRMFDRPRAQGHMIEGRAETRIHPAVTPGDEDLVITRHRTSAFTGSELAQILSANEIETLFLAGFATSGVVLSTACEADDRDFGVVVLSDCVADPDPDLHRLLLQEVFPAHGHVADGAEFLAALPA